MTISQSPQFGAIAENPALSAVWNLLRPTIIFSHLIGVLVVVTAGVLLTLNYSHRIAGPFYRISQIVGAVGKGNLTVKFAFRDGDELAPMENILKSMMTGLHELVQAAVTPLTSIHAQEADILEAIRTSTLPEEKKRHLENAISNELTQAVDALQVFKLEGAAEECKPQEEKQ